MSPQSAARIRYISNFYDLAALILSFILELTHSHSFFFYATTILVIEGHPPPPKEYQIQQSLEEKNPFKVKL